MTHFLSPLASQSAVTLIYSSGRDLAVWDSFPAFKVLPAPRGSSLAPGTWGREGLSVLLAQRWRGPNSTVWDFSGSSVYGNSSPHCLPFPGSSLL